MTQRPHDFFLTHYHEEAVDGTVDCLAIFYARDAEEARDWSVAHSPMSPANVKTMLLNSTRARKVLLRWLNAAYVRRLIARRDRCRDWSFRTATTT